MIILIANIIQFYVQAIGGDRFGEFISMAVNKDGGLNRLHLFHARFWPNPFRVSIRLFLLSLSNSRFPPKNVPFDHEYHHMGMKPASKKIHDHTSEYNDPDCICFRDL